MQTREQREAGREAARLQAALDRAIRMGWAAADLNPAVARRIAELRTLAGQTSEAGHDTDWSRYCPECAGRMDLGQHLTRCTWVATLAREEQDMSARLRAGLR